MHYLSKMVVFFASAMLCVFMLKSVRVGLVHLLPCYVKSVAVTVTERVMCRGGICVYGFDCESCIYCVQNKRRKMTILPPAGLF